MKKITKRIAGFTLGLALVGWVGVSVAYSNTPIIETNAVSVAVDGSIAFGTSGVQINAASIEGSDSLTNKWLITTVGTTSFTPSSNYSQIGSSDHPATSISFATTLPEDYLVKSISIDIGGGSKSSAGTVKISVDGTEVGSGTISGQTHSAITTTKEMTGSEISISVSGISCGIRAYGIEYTYDDGTAEEEITSIDSILGSLSAIVGEESWDLSGLKTMGKTTESPDVAKDISSFVTLSTTEVPGTVPGEKNVTVLVTPKKTGVTPKEISVPAIVESNPIAKFSKVTSIDDVSSKGIYGLSADGTNFASINVSSSYVLYLTTDPTVVGLFKFIPQDSNYAFAFMDNKSSRFTVNSYLNNTESTSLTKDATATNKDWNFKNSTNGIYVYHSTRHLGLNGSNGIKAYTSTSSNPPVYLYKYNDELLNWSESFMKNLTCDPTGQVAPSVEEWNTLASSFASLTSAQKATAKALVASSTGDWSEVAVEKYDYIINKYGSSTYSNFMDRNIIPGDGKIVKDNNVNMYIVAFAVASLVIASTITGICVIKKSRKEK